MDITLYQEFPQDLKQQWNELLETSVTNVPFLRFEYLYDWWQTRGGGEWPQDAQLIILAGFEAGKLIGIAPLFIARHEGRRKLLNLGCIEISDFLDLIVPAEQVQPFTSALIGYIQKTLIPQFGIECVVFYNLLEDSPVRLALLTEGGKAGFKVSEERLQHSPLIRLPGDWETYLNSLDKKQRHEIRRKMRRASEAEVPAELYITTDPDRLEGDIEDLFKLMTQDPDKEKFLTPVMRDQFRRTLRWAFHAGYLQLAFLTIDNEKAAVYFNLDYDNQIWVYNSGVDRRFMDYSPGWVLLGFLLQQANESGKTVFDFMRGNEDYKYKFGAVDRFVTRVTLE